MVKLQTLNHTFVEFIPKHADMVYGTVYISQRFDIAVYLCPCGCGVHAVVPFKFAKEDENKWKLTMRNGTFTFYPSIQMRTACKSHYFVKDSNIEWL